MVSCWLETQFVVCTCFEIPPLLQSIGSLEQVFFLSTYVQVQVFLYIEREKSIWKISKKHFFSVIKIHLKGRVN